MPRYRPHPAWRPAISSWPPQSGHHCHSGPGAAPQPTHTIGHRSVDRGSVGPSLRAPGTLPTATGPVLSWAAAFILSPLSSHTVIDHSGLRVRLNLARCVVAHVTMTVYRRPSAGSGLVWLHRGPRARLCRAILSESATRLPPPGTRETRDQAASPPRQPGERAIFSRPKPRRFHPALAGPDGAISRHAAKHRFRRKDPKGRRRPLALLRTGPAPRLRTPPLRESPAFDRCSPRPPQGSASPLGPGQLAA